MADLHSLRDSAPGVRDLRPEDPYEVDGLRPPLVCTPGTAEEVAAILGAANRHGASVIPWGGGTRMPVGFPPARADLALATTALDGVVEYEPADLTLTVQAGMRFGALQTLLRQHGQMLALDPPAADRATIGGIVASNSSGPLRLAYGTARDLVIGIRVANAEGMLTKAGGRVVKNVTGYDLGKLYTGSYGTLGIIIELSFKLHPLPQSQRSFLATFESAEAAQSAVQQMVKSPLSPAAIALLDVAATGRVLDLGIPEAGATLLVMASGFERAVDRQVRDMAAMCAAARGLETLEADQGSAAWDRIRAWSDLTSEDRDVILKISVPPADSALAIEATRQLLREAGHECATLAYAGTGLVMARLSGTDGTPSSLAAAITDARGWARDRRGSLVVERCPTALKEHLDVWGEVGSSFRIMQALKAQFDPNGVLSPGRFVGHL